MRRMLLILALAFVWSPTVAAPRSVRDADIGWRPALEHELRLRHVPAAACHHEDRKRDVRLQDEIDRRGDPRDALYAIFHDQPSQNIWGNLWYDPCDGGRLEVGVADGASVVSTQSAVRKARAYLADHKLTKLTRLVAVRSSYRALSDQVDAFGATFDDLLTAGIISYGIDTSRNAVVVDVDHKATTAQGDRLRAAQATSPVTVVLHPVPPPPPSYTANVTLDRSKIDRASPTLAITVSDSSCGADDTHDSQQRFLGVHVVKGVHVWELTARFRTTDTGQTISTCELELPDVDVVHTTVTLPAPLGTRAIVDGSPGASDSRFVLLPPTGHEAIRALVPRFIYTGEDCDTPAIRAAFHGLEKSAWCSY